MFTLSVKAMYGLTAVLELGLNYSKGPMLIRDIAEAHAIPQHYLEQILVTLKKGGIVESYRGINGGYTLGSHPAHVKVIDILSLLEGQLEILKAPQREGILHFFWHDIEKAIKHTIEVTIHDLILQKQGFDKRIDYEI